MKEKTKLRIIQILCIISLIITVFSIQRTYAKYFEKIDTTYDTKIKRWIIKVNGVDIHNKTEEVVMEPTFVENEHMNENVLVPGREGYFELLIDYTKVDVAFKCDFDLKQNNEEAILEDFEIYGYSIITTDADSGEETETKTQLETANNFSELTQLIDPTTQADEEKNLHIKILFRWNDENKDTLDSDEKTGMNNYEDTQYVKNKENLNYKVKVTFTQQM